MASCRARLHTCASPAAAARGVTALRSAAYTQANGHAGGGVAMRSMPVNVDGWNVVRSVAATIRRRPPAAVGPESSDEEVHG